MDCYSLYLCRQVPHGNDVSSACRSAEFDQRRSRVCGLGGNRVGPPECALGPTPGCQSMACGCRASRSGGFGCRRSPRAWPVRARSLLLSRFPRGARESHHNRLLLSAVLEGVSEDSIGSESFSGRDQKRGPVHHQQTAGNAHRVERREHATRRLASQHLRDLEDHLHDRSGAQSQEQRRQNRGV